VRRIAVISRHDHLSALAHPLRVRVLELLRVPASAAALARELGEPRQKLGYHLQQLLQAGLIRKVGERRTGGFVEDLYQAAAAAFVVSPRITWVERTRATALNAQLPLRALMEMGERLQRDAAVLVDRAAFEGAQIPAIALEAEVRFRSEAEREAFVKEYLGVLTSLIERHAAKDGERFSISLAARPHPGGKEEKS